MIVYTGFYPSVACPGLYDEGCLTVCGRKIFTAMPILMTTPTNFNAAAPFIGCALLRIAHVLHCLVGTIDGKTLR